MKIQSDYAAMRKAWAGTVACFIICGIAAYRLGFYNDTLDHILVVIGVEIGISLFFGFMFAIIGKK